MAYDAARGEVVLYGSFGDQLNDTWTWDGTTWTEEHPQHSPRGIYGQAMAYDAAREQVVLFVDDFDDYRIDTWTWDGMDWTETSSRGPGIRDFPGIAYDAARGQVVVFGGEFICDDLGCFPFKQTMTWEGMRWEKQSPPSSPPRRALPGMAYDEERALVVLFGGSQNIIGGDILGDTSVWDGHTWLRQRPDTSPEPRAGVGMAYDAARQEVVLFGGWSYVSLFGDTWTYDGITWNKEL